jgi:hypothetical protein
MDEQARKEKNRAYQREYRQRNLEKWQRYRREWMRNYCARNPDAVREKKRLYRQKNQERINAYQRQWYLKKKALQSRQES